MYSTCLHCHAGLGRNEAIEHFPVGGRVAFDADKGRLWAVCRACGRWNLSPLEERWEAIEEAERVFRDTRLRVSTDNIGLARAADGTDLVRVGRPRRPEFAAWRYGDAMGVRRRRALLKLGAGITLTGAAVGAGVAAGITTGIGVALLPAAGHLGSLAFQVYMGARNYVRATRVPVGGGRTYAVYGANLKETGLRTAENGGWKLQLRWAGGFETVEGAAARQALGVVLPRVNALGAKPERVRLASLALAEAGGPDAFLAELARRSQELTGDYMERRAAHRRGANLFRTISPFDRNYDWFSKEPVDHGALPRLDPVQRLALEMAVHEETERRAMEGELAALEAAWREAEEIAGIADRLALPQSVEQRLEEMREASK